MSTKKKDAGPKPEETNVAKNGPVKQCRVDDVSASIFGREHKGRVYYSVSFTRSYKSATGEWKYTHSFSLDDLGKVITVAQQASEYLKSLDYPEPEDISESEGEG